MAVPKDTVQRLPDRHVVRLDVGKSAAGRDIEVAKAKTQVASDLRLDGERVAGDSQGVVIETHGPEG